MSIELTARERTVLFLLAKGLRNEEISDRLFISVHTTKAHLEMIYEKLDVTNRVQATVVAISRGLVDIEDALNWQGFCPTRNEINRFE
jgi:DNA-binding CsgD family transcriptional regulator